MTTFSTLAVDIVKLILTLIDGGRRAIISVRKDIQLSKKRYFLFITRASSDIGSSFPGLLESHKYNNSIMNTSD